MKSSFRLLLGIIGTLLSCGGVSGQGRGTNKTLAPTPGVTRPTPDSLPPITPFPTEPPAIMEVTPEPSSVRCVTPVICIYVICRAI